AQFDRLEHRAVAGPPAADVVDGGWPRRPVKGLEGCDEIGSVDVVAHLLAAIPEHRVALAGHRAAHQVGEESVQDRASVVGPSQASPAEADRGYPEVPAVLLDQEVRRRL